jgi:hypothetical protein
LQNKGDAMAKSLQQAETDLRMAALAYAKASDRYTETYRRSGQEYDKPLNPETHAACRAANAALHAMEDAAHALAAAIAAEHRAEAL